MCAVAHWLEDEGIPTVAVALVREHAERIRPPRALWVPFELGRPVGPPSRPAFQRRVLMAALGLLGRTDAPVLEDFPEDAPEGDPEDHAGWACPIPAPPADTPTTATGRLLAEVERLRPWHALARERRGRSTVGASGLDMADAARLVGTLLDTGEAPAAAAGDAPGLRLKLACDDLKAFALEAAAVERHRAPPRALDDWFWSATAIGDALRALHARADTMADPGVNTVCARLLVPRDRL